MDGEEVYGRVTKVEERFCKLDILAIGEHPIRSVFVGIILQENVRDFQRDEVNMHQSFRPGDIVKARVIQGVGSGGTSRDQSVTLTTAEEHLGVVFAHSA
jgi:exosome complex component CSL4